MIWTVILKPEFGEQVVTTHSPIFLDTVESNTRILGSLASRWAKGPVRPISQFAGQPLFSRKRRQGFDHPVRKSTRLSARHPDVSVLSIEVDRIAANSEESDENQEHGQDPRLLYLLGGSIAP